MWVANGKKKICLKILLWRTTEVEVECQKMKWFFYLVDKA
jgi:hypothetical protein